MDDHQPLRTGEKYVIPMVRPMRKGAEFVEKVRAYEKKQYEKPQQVAVIEHLFRGDCKSYQDTIDFLLKHHTRGVVDVPRMIWVDDNGKEKINLDIYQYHSQIRYFAKKLKDKGVQKGDRVVLVYPPCFDFIPAFFACLYIGAIAVPVAPLNLCKLRGNDVVEFNHMVESCGAAVGLTNQAFLKGLEATKLRMAAAGDPLRKVLPKLKFSKFVLGSEAKLAKETNLLPISKIYYPKSEHEVAYLQYTSGSTSQPKGVMVTHCNYLSNSLEKRFVLTLTNPIGITVRSVFVRFPLNKESVTFNWAPLYHDLGLMYGPFCAPFAKKAIFISTLSFVANPILIPELLTHHGIGGANYWILNDFAMLHTMRYVRKQKIDLSKFDYSSLLCHGIGGDVILASTYVSYLASVLDGGLSPSSLVSTWGQAEMTCGVSVPPPAKMKRSTLLCVEKDNLAKGKVVILKKYQYTKGKKLQEREDGVWLVSAGVPLFGVEIMVVDSKNMTRCEDGTVGELWARGAAACAGYFDNEEATEETFHARIAQKDILVEVQDSKKWEDEDEYWVRSGDLGFQHEGEFFVLCRTKEVLVIEGKTFRPGDIEECAQAASNVVRKGKTLAVSITGDEAENAREEMKKKNEPADGAVGNICDGQQITILAEVRPWKEVIAENAKLKNMSKSEVYRDVCRAIKDSVLSSFGVSVQVVVLVKKGSLLKTSSGKKRRLDMRKALLRGELPVVHVASF